MLPCNNIIQSFLMGGFECCDMLNVEGRRVDILKETNHIEYVEDDYIHLIENNISSVREGIRWSQVELSPYNYNWEDFRKVFNAGEKYGVQQIWDLCHFGLPDDLTPLHPQFHQRFINLCKEFVLEFRKINCYNPIIVTPINEVSFLSWLGGEIGNTVPYTSGLGWKVKYNLSKAYIAGIKAMKEMDDNVIILTTEPLVDIVPPKNCGEDEIFRARKMHDEQYQVTDILLGRICPELGGREDLVDIIGYNFYFSNRFSFEPGDVISWTNEFEDSRFRPLHQLLEEGYFRYHKPIILSETSHPEEHRDVWLRHVLEETSILIQKEIPLWGVCWYPILDRPDWDDINVWHRSGIWNKRERSLAASEQIHKPIQKIIDNFHNNFQKVKFN